jgi:hypothetical protein
MSEFVNEGENLADYIMFMKNAIDRPGEVDAEIDALKDRFLAEGDPNSQYEAAKELIKDPDCFPALQPAAAEEFACLLLNSAAGAGHEGAVNLASVGLIKLSDAAAESLAKHPNLVVNEDLEALIGKYRR